MLDAFLKVIPQAILWGGYLFLGILFLGIMRTLLDDSVAWGNLFNERPGEPHHLSRYVLLWGTLFLAVKFLVGILTADSIQKIQDAVQLTKGLDVEEAAGASSVAYLLAKVTNGQILTLFGRRRS